tara:strand:+ start:828 stop:1328 length:501 start_codon:yes stop_codon:yes gene_type:complete
LNKRPKIKLKLTRTDKVLEIIGWIILFGMWIFTLTNYSELPEKIATHYNILGEADSYGKKGTIFFLPIISTIMFVGLTILTKYPHVYNNYPIEITTENAEFQYENANRMMRILKISVLIIFLIIIYQTIKNENLSGLGFWFLPFVLSIIFIPIIFFYKNANKKTNE